MREVGREAMCAGVDYSGAKDVPNNTWLALGSLTNLGLEIVSLNHCGSHLLAKQLNEIASLSVVGLDFPFSLPVSFLEHLKMKRQERGFQSWQEVAEYIAFSTFDDFIQDVGEFASEPKRTTDGSLHRVGVSPLHRGNPSMTQMTFHGIRMLATLDPARFFVMPFQDPKDGSCAVLEVYPRETLYCLSLPDTGYKGSGQKPASKRSEIVSGLARIRDNSCHKDLPRLSFPKNIERVILENDHALDAVVACYASAAWKTAPHLYRDALASDDLNVLLEGWIYAPSLLK
ncbi:MAG: hypothetical protein C5B53_01150 [Candidatus Melainabacteria bacterium]|nr:MAG: hypothetical protein C5B53_01150 [Candidatus Melainabacteria bacterium]